MGQGDDTCRLSSDRRRCARQGATIQFGKLQSRLIAFGSGISEVHVGAIRGSGQFNELGRKPDLRFGGEVVAHMRGLGRLFADCLDPLRVGVAERIHGDARQKIEILIAVDVPDAGAFAMIHHA